jgi:hypothetical protein
MPWRRLWKWALLNFGIRWRRVVGFTPLPPYLQENSPRCPLCRRAYGPQSVLGVMEMRTIYSHIWDRIPIPWSSRPWLICCTDWAIPDPNVVWREWRLENPLCVPSSVHGLAYVDGTKYRDNCYKCKCFYFRPVLFPCSLTFVQALSLFGKETHDSTLTILVPRNGGTGVTACPSSQTSWNKQ